MAQPIYSSGENSGPLWERFRTVVERLNVLQGTKPSLLLSLLAFQALDFSVVYSSSIVNASHGRSISRRPLWWMDRYLTRCRKIVKSVVMGQSNCLLIVRV